MSYPPAWPNTKINARLKLLAVKWQGQRPTVTPDEAARLMREMRDELTTYYEARLQEALTHAQTSTGAGAGAPAPAG